MNTLLRNVLAGATALVAVTAIAADGDSSNNRYTFNREETPSFLMPYYSAMYVGAPHSITTIRGDRLYRTKDTITSGALNPAGSNMMLLTHKKKGKRDLKMFSTAEVNFELHDFDQDKYGVPSAVAYTPDARNVIVATDKGIFIFDVRKFKPVDRIYAVPVVPNQMYVSPNGYYLVLVAGDKVVVYNYEEKTIRTTLDAGAPVADLCFTPDSNSMAVLSDDGLLTIYDTRTMTMRTTVDDLDGGIACVFNDSGKYIAVATTPDKIEIINLLKLDDRETFTEENGGISDVTMVKDAMNNATMSYGANGTLRAYRLLNLVPYYQLLVSDEVDNRMNEWMKMRPGETMEEYQKRVNAESTRAQRRLYEDEISTSLAGDLASMSDITLGNYNREKELLQVNLGNMPAVYLPVSKSDITAFRDGKELSITDAQYGLLPDDSFELIYGKFVNANDGKTYVYDNKDRVPMTFLENDDNVVSIELIQQQQIEELKLEELRQKVINEARHDNVISEHTNISVDSRVAPDYDANGNRILNYIVRFTYEVDPEFSAVEDFAPGKYHVGESGAATAMLNIVKQAFEGDFAKYVRPGARLKINVSGTADGTPILHGIAYDGSYGEYEDEPIRQDGVLKGITVTRAGGIRTNEQLAFVRALGVNDYLEHNISGLSEMSRDYNYDISVSEDKGSEYRRITAEFIFVNAF